MESSLPSQVSYAAATFVLEDQHMFRGFFRVLPSFELLGPAITKIMLEFNWTQFLVVDEEDALFQEVMLSDVLTIFSSLHFACLYANVSEVQEAV